jgi:hypothetical protein
VEDKLAVWSITQRGHQTTWQRGGVDAPCPKGSVLLDPFCGSAGMLVAGLVEQASKVIGIELVAKYQDIARRR